MQGHRMEISIERLGEEKIQERRAAWAAKNQKKAKKAKMKAQQAADFQESLSRREMKVMKAMTIKKIFDAIKSDELKSFD